MVARSWPGAVRRAGRGSRRRLASSETDPTISADNSARFGADRRLKSKEDFDRVFKRSARFSDPIFTVLARPRDQGGARLGLAVSVRAAGDAASRNRVKRLIRESFRQSQESIPSVDIVVMGKAGVSNRSNAEIRDSLKAHWQRISERCATSSRA
jgi:ribonuclease P protein component